MQERMGRVRPSRGRAQPLRRRGRCRRLSSWFALLPVDEGQEDGYPPTHNLARIESGSPEIDPEAGFVRPRLVGSLARAPLPVTLGSSILTSASPLYAQ